MISERLGTFINRQDLEKILSKTIRTKQIKASYFFNNKEEKTNRVFATIEDFTLKMLQYSSFPVDTILKTEEATKRYIFALLNNTNYKYYRREIILIFQTAFLDNLLTIKISLKEFKSIKKILGFEKTRQFSFFGLRYRQNEIKRGSIKERI
ncbi:hypothetical protein ES704_03011 [subsurface metagenome]|jgi:hypothetical protein